jgi:hypothetical protein
MDRRSPWASVFLSFLLLISPGVGVAQDAGQARAFVLKLYGAYHGEGPDYLGRGAPKVFSPRLLALIRRDRALTRKGEVGALDGDPICDCQDFDISHVETTIAPTGPGRVQAIINFINLGRMATVRLDLISVRGAWRIDNIHATGIADLAAYLRQHAGGR